MNRSFITIGIVGIAFLILRSLLQHSSTIILTPSGHNLTYTMAWGLGMDERLTLSKSYGIWNLASSGWMEIWKKPYNSGAVIYVSDDATTYYLGTTFRWGIIIPVKGTLSMTCDKEVIPELNTFGKNMLSLDWKSRQKLDPGASRFPQYIAKDRLSTNIAASSPSSRYYVGLRYIGRFGVVRGKMRGSGVGFVPSSKSAEPRMALKANCG